MGRASAIRSLLEDVCAAFNRGMSGMRQYGGKKVFRQVIPYKKTNGEIALSHDLKTKKIPKNDILAIVGQINGEEFKDIKIKEQLRVMDPYMGPNFTYVYDLKLYAEEELDLIGKLELSIIAGDAWKFAPIRGLDEARIDARALLKKIGTK